MASKPGQMALLVIPAVLYTAQNNLLYHALANLDAATYSVCYQSKILTTALFSVVLLKKRLTLWKWGALFLLAVGVALTEVASRTTTPRDADDQEVQSPVKGFICVMTAACTSGFAGVYFEMLLKSSRTSLWIRNIQMGIPSILLALLGVIITDRAKVASRGFFQGYNSIVVGVIVLQAAGGLVVAVVVKYADNIKKSFAAALSIVTSCFFSMILFRFRPNGTFMLGLLLVCVSVSMYSRPTSEKALPLVSGPAFNSVELNRRRGTSRSI